MKGFTTMLDFHLRGNDMVLVIPANAGIQRVATGPGRLSVKTAPCRPVVVITAFGFGLCSHLIEVLKAFNFFIGKVVQALATKEPEQSTVDNRH